MKPIDFILTWVDGTDPEWIAQKKEYERVINKESDDRPQRYRASDNFRYVFRGIEKFAPWVNNVYLVTSGHVPNWLNMKNDKLVHIKHKDYIPHEYLPTFNSDAIEVNLHRIQGLSENIVCFNDDMYIIKPTKPEDFFVDNLPCDSAVLNALASKRIGGVRSNF